MGFHVKGQCLWRKARLVFVGSPGDLDLAVVRCDLALPSVVDLRQCLEPDCRDRLRAGASVLSLGFGLGLPWSGA